MLLKIGNLTEAEAQYRELIKGNPENLKYFKGLEASLKLSPSQGPPSLFSRLLHYT
jgi:hypothetical protein